MKRTTHSEQYGSTARLPKQSELSLYVKPNDQYAATSKTRTKEIVSTTATAPTTQSKGFFLGGFDSFLPTVDADGHVGNVGNSGAVFTPADYPSIGDSSEEIFENENTGAGVLSDIAARPTRGNRRGGDTEAGDVQHSAQQTVGSSSSSNHQSEANSINVETTTVVHSSNHDDSKGHSHHGHHKKKKKPCRPSVPEPDEYVERIKFNRVRQVRILAFMGVMLLALLALFALLFLRYWSRIHSTYKPKDSKKDSDKPQQKTDSPATTSSDASAK
jgi:hypothetical protein